MADKHETIADIIAWLRRPIEGENAYLTLWRDEIADRIDAAHRREVREAVTDCDQFGDCAKLREVLSEIVLLTVKAGVSISCDVACGIIASKAKHALKQPPRNCDVGSAKEQAKRLNEWCNGRHCINCRFKGGWPDECKLKWAQMPYEEGGVK